MDALLQSAQLRPVPVPEIIAWLAASLMPGPRLVLMPGYGLVIMPEPGLVLMPEPGLVFLSGH